MWISYFKFHLDVMLQIDRSRSSGGVERTDFVNIFIGFKNLMWNSQNLMWICLFWSILDIKLQTDRSQSSERFEHTDFTLFRIFLVSWELIHNRHG